MSQATKALQSRLNLNHEQLGDSMRFRAISFGIALAAAFSAQAQDKWVIGQSAPLTGGNAQFGKDIRDGAQAYFAMLNAEAACRDG